MKRNSRTTTAMMPKTEFTADLPRRSPEAGLRPGGTVPSSRPEVSERRLVTSSDESVRNALRLVKEGGAEAVKVEGGEKRLELIHRLVEAEIPVMGHVGLTPQSVNALGGFHVQGKTADAARQVERDASAVEAAGAFSVVLESMPRELAARITEKLRIPTIGIGAGPDCDGQVLVFHDLVGFATEHKPKFVRQYANLSAEISRAVSEYCADVRSGRFPSDAESYHSATELREHLAAHRRS